jgi:hypothetical protein
MAPRANWKRFPAPFSRHLPGRIVSSHLGFREHQLQPINRNTVHRIKYVKVDIDTGEEVLAEDIMKGFAVDKDTNIEVSKDELESIPLESTRTIEIDEFVPKSDIDQRYAIRPYYLVPDGKVGHDAYAVIRETIRSMDMGREGHARSRAAHRAVEDGLIRSEQVRRRVRNRAARTYQPEARRHDRKAARQGASGHQRRRSHDRPAAEPEGRRSRSFFWKAGQFKCSRPCGQTRVSQSDATCLETKAQIRGATWKMLLIRASRRFPLG